MSRCSNIFGLFHRLIPVKEGIARELGFIVSVEASAPWLWVLDRSGAAILKRIPINF